MSTSDTIDLRPLYGNLGDRTPKMDDLAEFRFSRQPIIVDIHSPPPSDLDSGDETDPEDQETRIQSSWHHRALLGDETRVMYHDGSSVIEIEQVDAPKSVNLGLVCTQIHLASSPWVDRTGRLNRISDKKITDQTFWA